MKNIFFTLLAVVLLSCQNNSPTEQAKPTEETTSKYKTTGTVERLDNKINELISADAVIEVLADGFTWTEGPLWVPDGEFLIFSDIPPNRIMKWSENDGLSLYLQPSGYTGTKERGGEPGSNGLLIDAQGKLVLCQHGDRRLARMTSPISNPTPDFETIIDNYEGKKLNSPNDAVFDSKGNLYFTDPPYGLEKNVDDPAKEIPFQGVYRYSTDGRIALISDKMSRPNGIAFSPDEKTLYVANSDPKKAIWMAFSMNLDGTVASEKVLYDATGTEGKGLPDGLRVDRTGNIWATGPGGVHIFNPEGKLLGKIKTGQATSNCAFDTEQKTLYMTCDDYLMRIRL